VYTISYTNAKVSKLTNYYSHCCVTIQSAGEDLQLAGHMHGVHRNKETCVAPDLLELCLLLSVPSV